MNVDLEALLREVSAQCGAHVARNALLAGELEALRKELSAAQEKIAELEKKHD